jgi:type VI secretion system protein VasG
VRTGYVLVGMLKTKTPGNALIAISRQFESLLPKTSDNLAKILAGSPEEGLAPPMVHPLAVAPMNIGAVAPAAMWQEALKIHR